MIPANRKNLNTRSTHHIQNTHLSRNIPRGRQNRLVPHTIVR